MTIKKTKKLDIKSLGKTYYNIVDVSSQKVIEKLVENSRDLNLTSDNIEKISNIIKLELETSKSWGFDTLSKTLNKLR